MLCMARATLTIHPQYDIELVPRVPVIESLSIKLNDVVIVCVWVLITIFCGLSIAGLYGILGLKSFRDLFFDIFYSRENQSVGLLGWSMVILAVLLTGASASYIPRLIYFIYVEWTAGFSPIIRTLQMYPALLMVVQTLYQGTFLLRAYAKPSSLRAIVKTDMNNCKKQLESNIMLNFTLLLHCICITEVIEICVIEKDIVLQLAVGEMVYRLWAVLAFSYLRWRIEDQTDEQSEEPSTKADAIVISGVEDYTFSTVTSGSMAPLENDSTESAHSVSEDEVDSSPANTPMKTSSTEDPNSHDIDKTTTYVNTPGNIIAQAAKDEDYEHDYSKLVMQSLCKEVELFFESAHGQDLDLVLPQQCTNAELSRDTCTLVAHFTKI